MLSKNVWKVINNEKFGCRKLKKNDVNAKKITT